MNLPLSVRNTDPCPRLTTVLLNSRSAKSCTSWPSTSKLSKRSSAPWAAFFRQCRKFSASTCRRLFR
ncbi:hypothetical protein [Pseudomonas sp. CFBP 8772]|uniref:hypothetical protein n=1 Tax=Pseudomonas sp. CFBP 8772 TaxID=2775284 RepID=UPI00177B5728|nr:hypothetical protein [Pseudomonas sp. CFBP 8772]